jgi:hypothetical protein
MTAVDTLELLADDAWDAALASTGADYRFSHRAAAGRAFEAAYEEYAFEPYRVAYDDGVVALVPLVRARRRLDALTMMQGMPLGLEGTPVVLDGALEPDHVQGLFDALDAGRLTMNGGAGGSPPTNGAGSVATTHILDLTLGFERLWTESFSPTNRNKVRKAEKRGIQIADETDAGLADTYYDIYAAASEKWGYATPPYPRNLFAALLDSGEAELWLAREDGEAVAGSILLRGTSDILYWSTATLPGKQGLAPNNALLSGAIQTACERGVRYLDFGASAGLPGVQKFKESFGAQAVDYSAIDVRSLRYRALERLRR